MMSSHYGNYTSSGSSYRGDRRESRGYGYGGHRSESDDNPTLPPDRDLMENLNEDVVCTISKPSVESSTAKAVKPENVKYIGSYNWVEEEQPTIIVPGTFIVHRHAIRRR